MEFGKNIKLSGTLYAREWPLLWSHLTLNNSQSRFKNTMVLKYPLCQVSDVKVDENMKCTGQELYNALTQRDMIQVVMIRKDGFPGKIKYLGWFLPAKPKSKKKYFFFHVMYVNETRFQDLAYCPESNINGKLQNYFLWFVSYRIRIRIRRLSEKQTKSIKNHILTNIFRIVLFVW